MRSPYVMLSLGFLFILHTACGAKAVVDRDGQGGSDTSDAGLSEPCQFYCGANVEQGCTEDEAACVGSCEKQLVNVGSCASLLGAAYTCAGQTGMSPPNCADVWPTCADEVEAYQICVASAPCTTTGQCEVSAGHCNCKNDCGGALLESDCNTTIGGTCTCRFNGEVVGTCVPSGSLCDNLSGCCAGIFAASH